MAEPCIATKMYQVKLFERAEKLMQTELARFPIKETGGILLGYENAQEKTIEIVEAIDSGIHASHDYGTFSYDVEYVSHVAGILSELYTPHLRVIGVWHKHNHTWNPPFSDADQEMHRQMLEISEGTAVSILFQKVNDDGEYIMRTFVLHAPDECIEVEVAE